MGIIRHTNSSEDPDESSEDRHCLYGFLLVWQLFSFPVCVIFHHFILICNCRISPSSRAGINSCSEMNGTGNRDGKKRSIFCLQVCDVLQSFSVYNLNFSPSGSRIFIDQNYLMGWLWICLLPCSYFPTRKQHKLGTQIFFFFNLSQNSLRQLPGVFKRPNVIFMAVVSL